MIKNTYDVLVIGAHPDDAELFAGGTIALLTAQGKHVKTVSLTRGELGSRGSVEEREQEAAASAAFLGTDHEVLSLPDGSLADTPEQRTVVAELLRRDRPHLVITHSDGDRHPDHNSTHALVRGSIFLANVAAAPYEGDRHLVSELLFFLGNTEPNPPKPSLIVDVSETFDKKLDALKLFKTQFAPGSTDSIDGGKSLPPTLIASDEYWQWIELRARYYGKFINTKYGEPFLHDGPLKLTNFESLLE
jgi:bacillithiol biosynthesis deacetylase BshB1